MTEWRNDDDESYAQTGKHVYLLICVNTTKHIKLLNKYIIKNI